MKCSGVFLLTNKVIPYFSIACACAVAGRVKMAERVFGVPLACAPCPPPYPGYVHVLEVHETPTHCRRCSCWMSGAPPCGSNPIGDYRWYSGHFRPALHGPEILSSSGIVCKLLKGDTSAKFRLLCNLIVILRCCARPVATEML